MKIELSVGDTVWITYNNGKVYSGEVKTVEQTPSSDTLVTVLTDMWGYRTVTAENCSYSKPKGKTLFVRQSKS